MFGILLAALSVIPEEFATVLGKSTAQKKKEGPYTMAFLSLVTMPFLFLATGIIKNNLVFSFASIPTFLTRISLEILLTHVTIQAIIHADRSLFSFVRIGTIPLLLLLDLALGYAISTQQFIGIGLLCIAMFTLGMCREIKKDGVMLAGASAILAAATITLYKYDIAHFNSVEMEQTLATLILTIYFFIMAYNHETNPLRLLHKPVYFLQPVGKGLAGLLGSFAYLFAPASIITAVIRVAGVLFSMVAGRVYFHEQHLYLRIMISMVIIAGMMLLIV